jgi:hypothetical protein
MKLNGWKRIGIIASVVWMLGAGLYTFTATTDSEIKTASELTLSCESAHNWRGSDYCDKQSTDYLATNAAKWNPRIESAIVGIVPVPFAWGLAYLVLFLVRWVKRGFESPKT